MRAYRHVSQSCARLGVRAAGFGAHARGPTCRGAGHNDHTGVEMISRRVLGAVALLVCALGVHALSTPYKYLERVHILVNTVGAFPALKEE